MVSCSLLLPLEKKTKNCSSLTCPPRNPEPSVKPTGPAHARRLLFVAAPRRLSSLRGCGRPPALSLSPSHACSLPTSPSYLHSGALTLPVCCFSRGRHTSCHGSTLLKGCWVTNILRCYFGVACVTAGSRLRVPSPPHPIPDCAEVLKDEVAASNYLVKLVKTFLCLFSSSSTPFISTGSVFCPSSPPLYLPPPHPHRCDICSPE